jgi:phosphomannomutase
MGEQISRQIFRAYDIRGLYNKDISPEVFYKIGCAAGTYVLNTMKGTQVVVGSDIRQSSQPLEHALMAGITATGVHVKHTGTTSFGQTLFAGGVQQADLIAYVTASHLPPEWNGVKFYYGDGVGFPEKELIRIRDLVFGDRFDLADWRTIGSIQPIDTHDAYKAFFLSKFAFKRKHAVALDCGGGSMTLSAPEIFTSLKFHMTPVFCEPDPTFSKRPSDPKPKNLTMLVESVRQHHCDFGVAFDGDGDRSVIVDDTGAILSADQTGILLGKHGLAKHEGTVIVNVECSKAVREQLEPLGFRIKQIPVGHTFLTLEAKQEHAVLGIESSGHLILPQYFLFDDALVVPLQIALILDAIKKPLSDLVAAIPMYPTKKEEIDCPDELKFDVVQALKTRLSTEYEHVSTMDGVRVDLPEGWVLIRPSNTSPIIRLTAEADNEAELKRLLTQFMKPTMEAVQHAKEKTTVR